MKAKKRQPLDFSAAAQAPAPDGQPMPEAAPEAAPDLDLSIGDAPEPAAKAPQMEPPPLTLGDITPLTTLRQENEKIRNAKALAKRAEPSSSHTHVIAADAGSGTAVYAAAAVVSALWALAPIAYAIGYRQGVTPLQSDPLAMAVFALLAVGPAAFVFIAAYMIRQGAKLSAEARRTREMAQHMLGPAALAAAGAADAVAALRGQIEHASHMAAEARERMLSLRELLTIETASLAAATADSARTSGVLTGTVGREREAMQALSAALDAQSAAITDAIGRQARMVAEASDLAETQLREAEAALTARAADLTSAAVGASDAARTGAEDIARQAARLESAGSGVTEQLRAVDAGLAQQRVVLGGIAETLLTEQEQFAAQAESRVARMADLVSQAQASAEDLGDSALQGAESLRGLIAAAAEQFHQAAQNAEAERETIGEAAVRSFEALRAAAGEQRADLEQDMKAAIESLSTAADEARQAAQSQVDVAKSRVDQLNEAAFAAGQRADAVFESRMNEARNLIEQSAMMAEQAGARSAQRLDEGVVAARAAVSEVERLLSDVSERTGALGAEAQAQAEAVREAVEHGIGELLASARRAAEETQAIDAAFQDRVKRNYDMLSEAVSLMGSVAGAGGGSAQALRAAAPFAPLRPAAASAPASASAVEPPPAALAEPAPAAPPPAAEKGRQRLRLTPTTSDEDFRTAFEPKTPVEPPADEPEPPTAPLGDGSWTWKDLLSGLHRSPEASSTAGHPVEAPSSEDTPDGRRLAVEIAGMGIDADALLPRPRIEEIAAAVQTGDGSGAREVVKRLAPAAIRRLVRRLFSDRALREEAERFIGRYGGLVQEAASQDRKGFLVATLLASASGRTYLLLDAAAGDIS